MSRGTILDRIQSPGWVLVRSRVLGEDLLWVRDRETKVPVQHSINTRYTVEELLLLCEQRPDEETLRTIHQAKVVFEGDVVPELPETTIADVTKVPATLKYRIPPLPEPKNSLEEDVDVPQLRLV